MTESYCLENFIDSLNLQSQHQELLQYNLTGGKYIRKTLFEDTLKLLNSNEDYASLGWCIELLQAYFLITDDIIDNSPIRRGKTSWYYVKGMQMLRQSSYLQCLITKIISSFSNHKQFYAIQNLFQEVTLKTWFGQAHDSLKNRIYSEEDILKYFNFDNYKDVLIAKTSYYTLMLPIKLAYLCCDLAIPNECEGLCNMAAFYMQFQDDYLNFIPEKCGKSGTDIEERKITWYLCKLVELNKNNKNFMDEFLNYYNGGDTKYIKECVNTILADHDANEERIIAEIRGLMRGNIVFNNLLKALYKRRV
ncbi:hypothetical protein COBT_002200 [Conglomerata obtusa]